MPAAATWDGKLATPTVTPPQVIQRIKNLQCPPPLQPSKITPELKTLYENIETQSKLIQTLESEINDLEKRYKLNFAVNETIKYDLKPSDQPYIKISGSMPNIILEFHMWTARKGMTGLPGIQGSMGKTPPPMPLQGVQGYPGYYGIRGDLIK
jgi:hypothetical protein